MYIALLTKVRKGDPNSIEKQTVETFSVTCKYICARRREKENSCTPNSAIVSCSPLSATVPAILSHYQQMHQMFLFRIFIGTKYLSCLDGYQLTKFMRLYVKITPKRNFMRVCYVLSIYKGSAIAGKALSNISISLKHKLSNGLLLLIAQHRFAQFVA